MSEKPEKKTEKPKETEEKKKKPVQHEQKKGAEESANFKGIVRIAGRDIRGHVKLNRALTYVRGLGTSMSVPVAQLIHRELNIPADIKIGELQESQIEQIDKLLFSLHTYKLPKYLFNRRCDMETGSDKHVIMNDLLFSLKQDVEREKKIYTWKGYRHAYGQKVRGQKTRNTGRTGMAVGVLRKAVLGAAAAAAAPGAPGAAAPAAAGGKAAPPAAGGGKTAAPAAAGGKTAAPAAKAAPTAKPAEKK